MPNTVPDNVLRAARLIHRDISEAMDVLYGEIGGKDDTPQDVAATEKQIADDMRIVLDWVLSQTPTEPRAVYHEPGDVQYEYDEDDNQVNPSVGWNIAWGCRVSFSHYDGCWRVSVSVSDAEKRNGGSIRAVTRHQIRAFAHHLIQLTEAVEDGGTAVNDEMEWRNCTPELLACGVDCATTPRRPGHGPEDPGPLVVSHQHLVPKRTLPLPEPDPDVRAGLVLNGVHADWASVAQFVAQHMDMDVADVAADLGMFFAVVEDEKRAGGDQ